MDPALVRTSKFLSLILRHKPQSIGLSLDSAGWVTIDQLLKAAQAAGAELDFETLLRVIHENDKQRFALSPDGLSIRASQGHSVEVDLGLRQTDPPATLFHGTIAKFLDGIRAEGLIPGARQHVHLSADRRTAESVGRRRGEPIVLVINAAGMAAGGHAFYLSQNGVWLTEVAPVEYIGFP